MQTIVKRIGVSNNHPRNEPPSGLSRKSPVSSNVLHLSPLAMLPEGFR